MDPSQPEPSGLTGEQVIRLAQSAFDKARGTTDRTNPGSVQDITQGITIDLSHSAIEALPTEVFAIINRDLERLALSHNSLFSLPAGISHCTSLRYLNVRHNAFRKFPTALCELRNLEILDISQNKLEGLPEALSRMASLKVLSVRKNSIQDLPPCIGDMGLLQVLKVDSNPLNPALQSILDDHSRGSAGGSSKDRVATSFHETAKIKHFLRLERSERTQVGGRSRTTSSEANHQQHLQRPSRSGGFPIQVDDNGMTPHQNLANPKPIHPRTLSAGQNPASATRTKRSGNSQRRLQTQQQNIENTTGPQPPEYKNPKKALKSRHNLRPFNSEGAGDFRDFSIGAELSPETHIPYSAADQSKGQEGLLDTLDTSSRKGRESDHTLKLAQALYLSIHQLHWAVKALSSLFTSIPHQQLDLDSATYDVESHLGRLAQSIQQRIKYAKHNDVEPPDHGEIRSSAAALTNTYQSICFYVAQHVDIIVDKGNMPLVRTLVNLVYGSVMVLRAGFPHLRPHRTEDVRSPLHSSDNSVSQKKESKTTPRDLNSDSTSPRIEHSATKKGTSPESSLVSTSPRRLHPRPLPTDTGYALESANELGGSIRNMCKIVLEILPQFHQWLLKAYERADSGGVVSDSATTCHTMISLCSWAISQTEELENYMSLDTTESIVSNELTRLFHNSVVAFTELGNAIRSSKLRFQTPAKLRKGLYRAKNSLKETAETFAAVKSPNALATVTTMTPLQASLGPAIGALLPR